MAAGALGQRRAECSQTMCRARAAAGTPLDTCPVKAFTASVVDTLGQDAVDRRTRYTESGRNGCSRTRRCDACDAPAPFGVVENLGTTDGLSTRPSCVPCCRAALQLKLGETGENAPCEARAIRVVGVLTGTPFLGAFRFRIGNTRWCG
jgi:hypothetical protein